MGRLQQGPHGWPDTSTALPGALHPSIAIGNERRVAHQDGQVTFRCRDRRRNNLSRTLTLAAPDFVRRFLLHVLPRRFVRVRHLAFQANTCPTRLLTPARELLHASAPPHPADPALNP